MPIIRSKKPLLFVFKRQIFTFDKTRTNSRNTNIERNKLIWHRVKFFEACLVRIQSVNEKKQKKCEIEVTLLPWTINRPIFCPILMKLMTRNSDSLTLASITVYDKKYELPVNIRGTRSYRSELFQLLNTVID